MKPLSIALLFGTSALGLAATPAAAQGPSGQTPAATQDASGQAPPAPPAAAGEPSQAGLEDIIVTATRAGETNIQKTPIAVTAFSPELLKERGVTTALDLNGLAPNVSIGGRAGTGTSQGAVTIRGIGVDANPPASPAIGIYVDDVYIPASYGNLLGTYDLAQLAILRGPQGTLFGRNTIGGALQYTSVKPKIGDLSGFLEGTIGNQQHRDISGGINLPLADWAALRVSGAYTNRDGYVHDLFQDNYRGSEHNNDERVQLRLQPTSRLLIDLKLERVEQNSNGVPALVTGIGYDSILGKPFEDPMNPGHGAFDQYISPGFYTTYGRNDPESFHSTLKLAQGVIGYDLAPDLKIKSITAYSENKDLLLSDQDGFPISLFATSRGNDLNKLFTQELQLSGKILDGRLHFTLGAYYYDENSSNTNSFAQAFGGPLIRTFGDYDVKTKSYAGYGQATFDLTSRLSIVGGVRYTKDDVNVTNPSTMAYGPQKVSFDNWSPLAGVNFQMTPDVLFYAKWSRGFRAGSFSPNLFAVNAFGPETLESYEAGARLEFFGHRVRINPTLFTTRWNNIQFNSVAFYFTPPPPGSMVPGVTAAPIVQNAGDARTKGAELETQFQVTPRLMLSASGALFEGHYTSLLTSDPDGPGPIPPSTVANVNFNTPLKRAPKRSFAVGGRYEVPLRAGNIALSANYAWQAHQRSATSNNDNIEIAAYGLLTARLTYTGLGDHFSIAAFANNLTDKRYAIGGEDWPKGGLIPQIELDVGRPREFGLTARYNFF